jgi:hypothetical protein
MRWRCTIAMCPAVPTHVVVLLTWTVMHGDLCGIQLWMLDAWSTHIIDRLCRVLALLQLWSSASSQLWPRCPWQWAASA